jgi:hypothetical protein
MHKLLPFAVLLAGASIFCQGSMAVEGRFAADISGVRDVMLVGGMGGGTGGGMGGGGMTGGGMTGGGMGGMTGGGMGGMSGGMTGYGAMPGNSFGGPYNAADPNSAGAQPAQYYLCITPYDQCSLASSPGSLRSGSSCTCSTGHRGTIR